MRNDFKALSPLSQHLRGRRTSLMSLAFVLALGARAEAQPLTEGDTEEAPEETTAPTSEDAPDAVETTEEGPGSAADALSEEDTEEPTEGAAEPGSEAPADPPSSESTSADGSAEEKLAALEARLLELQTQQEEAEMEALLTEEDVSLEEEKFKVYGFMDMGMNAGWLKDESLAKAVSADVFTFVTGNINVYFDFNPHPDWRALTEIRFTGAPHGRVDFDDEDGTTTRVNTQQFDDHGTAANAPVWPGTPVIERAWIEWKRFQQLRVRTGNWFTPFGIWNVDHGSPTLITVALPQFIQQLYIPLRQTGVQVLGSHFVGSTEIGYRAWLSNGRNELGNLDFNDDKAFGARVFVQNGKGKFNSKLGGSFHHGHVTDEQPSVAFRSDGAIIFPTVKSWGYVEDIIGADASIDIGDTRIRLEGMGRLKRFDDGARASDGFNIPEGGVEADRWTYAGYVIVAHQLPWFGLEPFVYGEATYDPGATNVPTGIVLASGGLNIRFTSSALLKTQVTRSLFYDWANTDNNLTPSDGNLTQLMSRIVLAY